MSPPVPPRFVTVLLLYDRLMRDAAPFAENHTDKVALDPIEQLQHARWMVGQMIQPTDARLRGKFEKATTRNRWLGYIQGTLVANGLRSIADLREDSRGLEDDA